MLPRRILLCALAASAMLLSGCSTAPATPGEFLPQSPPAAPPIEPGEGGSFATLASDAWLDATSEATGIPRRALVAYASTATAHASIKPECNLQWTTLAAIGFVESHHGEIFGGSVQEDGTVAPAVLGPQLNGEEFDEILDSDDGLLDGDTEYDRAVGPMQLLPQTWGDWHGDPNQDGVEDPHNIDDAVTAAAGYLCKSGGDLSTSEGWRAAITAYNSAPSYIVQVLATAVAYGEDASAS